MSPWRRSTRPASSRATTGRYFIRRRSRAPNLWQTTQYTRFPKLGILVDCSNHLILGYLTDQGPKPDIRDLEPTLAQTSSHVRIEWLTADAGYDSESNHRHCREQQGIRSLIPPKHGRPTNKPAKGRHRRRMQTRFDHARYGQRWQVETVVSMIKRRLGSATTGRSYWSRRRDLMLMVLTHNIMILWRIEVFYRAHPTPFRVSISSRYRCAPNSQTVSCFDSIVNELTVSRVMADEVRRFHLSDVVFDYPSFVRRKVAALAKRC